MKKQVLIISGPTGSGESTITKAILERFSNFKRLVTATTRKPRLEEKDRVDYYFFSKEKFLEAVDKGDIVEYTYIKNRDSYYGTYKPDLDEKIKAGNIVIVNVDGVGVDFYKRKYGVTAIFIKPGSIEELRERLRSRDPKIDSEELEHRIENAKAEIKNEEKFYDYIVFNENDKLKEAIDGVIDVLKKEDYELK
ncbi:MAG: guanylate kinase [Candidatus Magasanikiibacteriota bacterium]